MSIQQEKDLTLILIANHLETVDKRYMFLKILIPHLVNYVRLEGSINITSNSIYNEAKKHGLLKKLETKLRDTFLK